MASRLHLKVNYISRNGNHCATDLKLVRKGDHDIQVWIEHGGGAEAVKKDGRISSGYRLDRNQKLKVIEFLLEE